MSTDLVRWRRQPPAVEPDGTGADGDGCWSGCARIVDGQTAIFYTGIVGLSDADRVESVCRAVGSSDSHAPLQGRGFPDSGRGSVGAGGGPILPCGAGWQAEQA
jgi:hypothetical protein